MSYSLPEMRRDGIRPTDWDWYRLPPPRRVPAQQGPPPTAKKGRAKRRVWVPILWGLCSLQILPAAAHSPFFFLAEVLSVGWFIGTFVRFLRAGTRNRRMEAPPAPQPSYRMVFGTPGGIAAAAHVFGEDAVAAGAEGEERTAGMLDLLADRLPGVSVFHGLRFPGSARADVDHAVVSGNHVFLIDSKLYRWGQYQWGPNREQDEVVRSDGYGRPRANSMHAAAEGYRRLLGPRARVSVFVLLHGRNVSVADPDVSARGVFLMTASEGLECIGNTIREGLQAGQPDDPRIRGILLSNLKQEAA